MKKYRNGRFIKLEDVRDGEIKAEIAGVVEGQYDKPNLILKSGDTLSLNKHNVRVLTDAFGFESDLWVGKMVKLFAGEVTGLSGNMVGAVVVEPVAKAKAEMDDEIPF